LRWRGSLPAGRVVPQIASAIDLLPTLASLAKIPLPSAPSLDGRDLSPLFQDSAESWPPRTLFNYLGGRLSVRTDRFRLDPRGALYDMLADPSQTRDVASEHPEVVEQLRKEIGAWRSDVLARLPEKDERPFPVGYREWPRTWLPARDGTAHGGLRRSAAAPNCSYFVNWTNRDARAEWQIDVHAAGVYAVELWYTCAKADEGSRIEVSCGDVKIEGKVAPAWDPPLITDQDVIPRPAGESVLKEFRPLRLGKMRLAPGSATLSVRASEIVGREALQLRGLHLTLLDE